ncbi:MAG: sigma-70 family RNA polymerase sigma factor [Oscillospiraceae bacterium]|nr:sigma-70 family RNA polymerase sigma factor [Oscillospiraceae bacterium]
MQAFTNENKIKYLGVNEYFFLTENLEFTNGSEVQGAVRFIVVNKRKNLERTVKSVIENELDESEKTVIKLFYYNGFSALAISKICKMARSSVYRNLNSGLRKIENAIKYVLEYEGFSAEMSADELVKFVKGAVS